MAAVLRVLCVVCAVAEGQVSAAPSSSTTVAPGSPAASKVKAASPSSGSHVAAYRYRLAQAFCPTADAADKMLLACQNYEINHKIKLASDADKVKLTEERKKLYTAVAAKPAAEKKANAAALKALYTKAFAKYCPAHATSDVCTNESMKKLYGGNANGGGIRKGARRHMKKA